MTIKIRKKRMLFDILAIFTFFLGAILMWLEYYSESGKKMDLVSAIAFTLMGISMLEELIRNMKIKRRISIDANNETDAT